MKISILTVKNGLEIHQKFIIAAGADPPQYPLEKHKGFTAILTALLAYRELYSSGSATCYIYRFLGLYGQYGHLLMALSKSWYVWEG